MTLSCLERSKYYRGLLILVRKDGSIDRRERDLMLEIGKVLDFDARFCQTALDDLLRNTQISDEPVVFSDRAIAECFLADAIALACADDRIHPHELACLRSFARANGFEDEWLDAYIVEFLRKRGSVELPPGPAIRQYV